MLEVQNYSVLLKRMPKGGLVFLKEEMLTCRRFHKLECNTIAALAANEEKRVGITDFRTMQPSDIITLEIIMARLMNIYSNHNVQDFSAMPVKMNDPHYYRPITAKDTDLLLRECMSLCRMS